VHAFPAEDIPLGITAILGDRSARELPFAPGDALVLVTDGFFEWANPSGELFGIDRLSEVIRAQRAARPAELIAALHAAVTAFARGTPQEDDLTAVVIKRA